MRYTDEDLDRIFEKSSGECAYCEKQLAWTNYGREGSRGAWQVDHRVPLSRDGADHLNNLSAACVDCNRSKGDMTAREFMATFEPATPRRSESGVWDAVASVGALAFLWWLFYGRSDQRQ